MKMRCFCVPIVSLSFWIPGVITVCGLCDPRVLYDDVCVRVCVCVPETWQVCLCLCVCSPGNWGQSGLEKRALYAVRALQPRTFRIPEPQLNRGVWLKLGLSHSLKIHWSSNKLRNRFLKEFKYIDPTNTYCMYPELFLCAKELWTHQ